MHAESGSTAEAIARALATARAHHEAGRLREAETLYRDVLARAPDEADALHRLGIIAWQGGGREAGIELLKRAIAVRPADAEMHHDLGNVLQSGGRLDEALACYRRTVELEPGHADAHFNAGTVLQQQGRLDEAAACYREALVHAPDLADAHVNLGTLDERAGRLEQAVTRYERALALSPRSVHALYNLGNALRMLGRFDEAAARYRDTLALDASHVMARINLGGALLAQGLVEEASAMYREALAQRPDLMTAHYGHARALEAQGRVDDAIGRYRKALRLAPGHAGLHNDLGTALAKQGRTQDACAEFRAAIALQPQLAEAHNNLGHALHAVGDLAGSVASYRAALALRDTPEVRANLAQGLRAIEHGADVPEADALLLQALTEGWARPEDLARAVARRIEQARPAADDVRALTGDALLCALLERAPVTTPSLERLLTDVRRRLLEATAGDDPADEATLGFACALARQCFIGEYVFACDDAEAAQVQALQARVAGALSGGQAVSPSSLAVLGAYVPLGAVPGIERAQGRAWPAPLQAVLTQQVEEPRDERERAGRIERLTDIADPVSLAVQRQYEENPYPRWSGVPRETPAHSVNAWLRSRFPAASIRPSERSGTPGILIAGCGTGREAIETAQRFPGADILAVDLSRASLAYAQRRSDAYGVANVRYAQADIAALGALARTFDVVSSVGVLHHMADAEGALRILASLLRPGGFVQVGLYSEAARRHVDAAQRFVTAQGYPATPDGIRRARAALHADARFGDVTALRDFYTTSECRDLLFHAHETRFTLPRVRDLLNALGFRMLGFVLDPQVLARYGARFPADVAKTDFDSWSAFEAESPDTFAGMYVLWAQKR
ncbi:MAG TPA: tetratricopeptide repeat protein [Casimicrobiaceae bacterium]